MTAADSADSTSASAWTAVADALDVDAALGEARRVSRPGGRLAICKWTRPRDNEFFVLLITLGAGNPASLRASDPPVDDAIRRARLAVHHSSDIPVAMEMRDAAALEAALVCAGALQAAGGAADRQRLLGHASPYRQPDGSYRFKSTLRYVIVET